MRSLLRIKLGGKEEEEFVCNRKEGISVCGTFLSMNSAENAGSDEKKKKASSKALKARLVGKTKREEGGRGYEEKVRRLVLLLTILWPR